MLDDALEALRSARLRTTEKSDEADQDFNISLAKIQFVSVYLANPDIPIPKDDFKSTASTTDVPNTPTVIEPTVSPAEANADKQAIEKSPAIAPSKPSVRPSLKDSSFSFMLGENRHRSSFVSSAADLPEQRRDSESNNKTRTKQLTSEAKSHRERRGSESEDDGFTLTKMQGGRG
jgi:TBC1 domain family protein 5